MKYNTYFANVILINGKGKIMEIVAISEESAVADIMEAMTGVESVQIAKLR